MADTRLSFETARKPKLSFSRKLVLGITTLSVLGLVVMFGIVNTVVRGIIYDNVIGITRRDTIIHAREIDAWFKNSNQFVEHLTVTWLTTGITAGTPFGTDPIATSFVNEYDFFMDVYVGFADGRFIDGSGWIPEPGWDPTTRPWYKAALAARGETVTVLPFAHNETGYGLISAVAKWVPDLGGMEAVVAAAIRIDTILDMVRRYEVVGGGYLILLGPNGEIISHQNPEFNPTEDGMLNLRDIHKGERLTYVLKNVDDYGNGITRFMDAELGLSYFMVFPLTAAGWSLAAVVPAEVTQGPVFQSLLLIMATLAVLLIALFLFTTFFVSRLTQSMEESGVVAERLLLIFDNMPMASTFRNRNYDILYCNAAAPKMFGLSDSREFFDKVPYLLPEFQPDGSRSAEKGTQMMKAAFETGKQCYEMMYQKPDGEPIPCEVSLVRVDFRGGDYLLTFVRDLREFYEGQKRERMLMQRMQTILDTSPLMCMILDEKSNVLEVNREVERLLGISDKRIFMNNFFDFSPEFQPDGMASREKAVAEIRKALETGHARYEWTYQTLNGKKIPSEEILEHVKIEGRDLVVAYTRDLRDFHRYRETERLAQQRLQAMLDSSPLACSIIDEKFNVLEINQETLNLFGMTKGRKYADSFFDYSPKYQPDGRLSREKLMEKTGLAIEAGKAYFEWMHQTRDGKPIPTEKTIVRVTLNGKKLLIVYTRDLREINEAVAMVKQLENLAFTDTLTGARNRRYFNETAERELKSCFVEDQDFTIVMFDIDHFKRVNDTYGHDVGDEVLKLVVARARHSLKHDTLVARFGGEEFVVVLPGVSGEHAMKAAGHLRQKIGDTPFVTGSLEIKVTVSLGVASKTADCVNLPDIVKNADKALYHAKATGRNRAVSYDTL